MLDKSISRRRMLVSSLGAGTLPIIAAPAFGEIKRSYRNVLLLISDDHGLDAPCYGNTAIKTPCLDQLASEGVRFTNAFCTTASCSASRSVILTGLHNHLNGQFGHAHDYHHFQTFAWVRTLPRLLKDQGYTTGIVGKFHVAPESLYPFDYYPPSVKYGGSRNVNGMADCAREFFEANRENPFYLHIGFSDPHRAGKGFANENNKSRIEPTVYSPDGVIVPPYLPDRSEVRRELAEHYQAVSRMDQGVGLILQALKETGKVKDTLVIYISDNGIPFPGAKTNCYDPGLHLPMIVRSPEQSRLGIVNNAMVSFTDLVPAILEWTGAPPPNYELHGRSFLPILEQENPSGWDEIYFSHTFHEITMYYPVRGIRTRRYKYINNLAHDLPFPFASDLYASATWRGIVQRRDEYIGCRKVKDYLRRPTEELYDLENDPNEVINLASRSSHRRILQELSDRTQLFRHRTKDPWLILNNYADGFTSG